LLELAAQSIDTFGIFWGHFSKNWAAFYPKIWKHWLEASRFLKIVHSMKAILSEHGTCC